MTIIGAFFTLGALRNRCLPWWLELILRRASCTRDLLSFVSICLFIVPLLDICVWCRAIGLGSIFLSCLMGVWHRFGMTFGIGFLGGAGILLLERFLRRVIAINIDVEVVVVGHCERRSARRTVSP